jgi:transposase
MRAFVQYKAQLAGVIVVAVDPRYTSQACNVCGYVDKRNRPDQATFCCVSCRHAAPADFNAACNIRDRAAVIQPMASNLNGSGANQATLVAAVYDYAS